MTLAYWCVLIAALLPYPFTVLAKTGKGYSNHTPRLYLEKTQGWRQRAHWVQVNTFEAFPFFAAGVIIAHLSLVPQNSINMLAIIFIITRILYGIFYVLDKATLRSLVWFLGFLCCIGFFIHAASAKITSQSDNKINVNYTRSQMGYATFSYC